MTVTTLLPVTTLILNARHWTVSIMAKAGVSRRWHEKIAYVLKLNSAPRCPVNVHTKQRFVVNFNEQSSLILKLKVIPEPGIEHCSEGTALWVIVHAFRV
jgi:hypothetical protein